MAAATGGTSCPMRISFGFDDADDAREKIRRGAVIDRDDDDAAQQAAPERDDPLRTVLAPENNLVAFTKSERVQACGEPARVSGHFGIRVTTCAKPVVVDEKSPRAFERSPKKSRSVSRTTSEL